MVKVLGILKKWSLYLIGDFSPVILDSEAFASKTKLLFDKKCFHQHLQKLKDKLISRRAKNRGTTFIQWTCHSLILMQLYDWVAWLSSLDGSQHRHFSGLKQVKINSQLSYYNVFLSLRQLEKLTRKHISYFRYILNCRKRSLYFPVHLWSNFS